MLEHPEASAAWKFYKLVPPSRSGGWIRADVMGGWTCCVEQGHYGHRARKATWLYACKIRLPDLIWGQSVATIKPRPGRCHIRERRTGAVQRMGRAERRRTPQAFADLMIGMARSVEDQPWPPSACRPSPAG